MNRTVVSGEIMPRHPFTYKGYGHLIEQLRVHGYEFSYYADWQEKTRPVIMRHDIDFDVQSALKLAEFERSLGVASTYFVLTRTGMYNYASAENLSMLKAIMGMGHEVGLHFDETIYQNREAISAILHEAKTLSAMLDKQVKCVSMHRPSKDCLEGNWDVPGIVNSYGSDYLISPFKYLSDSRRQWREPVFEIVKSEKYSHLHILTHAFWYHDEELSLRGTLKRFIENGSVERRRMLSDNFTDLDGALGGVDEG